MMGDGISKLTPKDQGLRLAEDSMRVYQGYSPVFSVGQHLELLIQRVDALEAAQAIAARSDETQSGSAEGKSADPQGCAQGGQS
jgi:hypothetical protein